MTVHYSCDSDLSFTTTRDTANTDEEDETLQQTAIRRKLGFFGHVMRSDRLEKEMMLACGEGWRRRGRPRRRWMDEIHEVTGMKLAEPRAVTTERKQWRRFAMMVARVPGTDSTR